MEKISFIESTSMGDLKRIIKEIIMKEGFIDIHETEDTIIASLNNPMSSILNVFVLFPFQLSGEVDIDRITNIIAHVQQVNSANSITIVSKNHISNGFIRELNSRITNFKINYIGRDKLINLIDKDFPLLWKHNDSQLLKYEEYFEEVVLLDNQLKGLKIPSEKCQKLLNIYIDPQLFSYEEDKKTHTPIRRRAELSSLLQEKKPVVLSGDSGSGKSSLLKRLGILMIKENEKINGKKYLPIYITALDLLKKNHDIKKVIEFKLERYFAPLSLNEISNKYLLSIFIDSIDEFEEEIQISIINKLNGWYKNNNIQYFIGTREKDNIEKKIASKDIKSYDICKFNFDQIKRFVSAFFSGDEFKTNNLLEALKENKIIERLPITPLSLSLISILYDETDFEIPATITDIYDNFNDLIIGKAVVSSKVEFIDISFKERILSLYAYKLMRTKDHHPLSIEEFIDFFRTYFDGKTLPIKEALLEDVLTYLIHNTGILCIKEEKWIVFTHDSYMEYYCAVEIFKFERSDEDILVDNFFDMRWQNVAVFYAGKTKDMPDFANKINIKLQKSRKWNEFIAGIQGCGYLLQALYQTDNSIRKELILTALDLVLESNESFKKSASDDTFLFKNYNMPILQLMNFIHFYEMFNSITLKDPLQLSFDKLNEDLNNVINKGVDKNKISVLGYKLLELAFTLDSKRINSSEALEEIVFNTEILKDPTLNILAQFTLEMMGKNGYKEMREELKKKYKSLSKLQKGLIENDTSKIRFSLLDTINADRKVKIFVEGKTDATILEHAYMVLTNGCSPYWNIAMASQDGKSGSSTIVTKNLETAYSYIADYHTIIGLYDHDFAGLSEYRRINKIYTELITDTVKKHQDAEIYAISLPVPGELSVYLQDKQEFNFFEMEHYFDLAFLNQYEMLSNTAIPNIFEIKGKKKVAFSESICKIFDPNVFRYFLDLFRIIDKVSKMEIDYVI